MRILRLPSMKYFSLFVIMVFTLFPFFWLVFNSFKPSREIFTSRPTLNIQNPTLENYQWALGPKGANLGRYLLNSIFTATLASLMTIIFATTAGYALGRFHFPGRDSIAVFLILSQMFQGPLIMVPWYKMASTLGIINTRLVLVLIYGTATIPTCAWLMSGFYSNIPKDLEEAAMIDGCSITLAFFRVILPLVIPAIVATGLYSFIIAWNDYQYALILTSSDFSKTVQVGLAELMGFFGKTSWGGIMASGVLTSLPVVILFIAIQRYLIEGLTSGAVKG
ncbi:MAG: carbohydrate ABC transporter permease [Candidatus Caldatribacteriaceae bacterium]